VRDKRDVTRVSASDNVIHGELLKDANKTARKKQKAAHTSLDAVSSVLFLSFLNHFFFLFLFPFNGTADLSRLTDTRVYPACRVSPISRM